MLEKYLQEIGLSDKESAIYLALLATDNSSVIDLAEKTKIKRPTAYVILESLAKKGLVSGVDERQEAFGKRATGNAGEKNHYFICWSVWGLQ